jgi:flagellar biosynthesis protein FliR
MFSCNCNKIISIQFALTIPLEILVGMFCLSHIIGIITRSVHKTYFSNGDIIL